MADQKKPDGVSHETMFQLQCRGAFKNMDAKLESIGTKADENAKAIAQLTATVKNGLTTRVESIDKRMWAVAGGVIIELVGVILLLVFR